MSITDAEIEILKNIERIPVNVEEKDIATLKEMYKKAYYTKQMARLRLNLYQGKRYNMLCEEIKVELKKRIVETGEKELNVFFDQIHRSYR